MAGTADVCAAQIVVFMQARAEEVEGIGVVRCVVDDPVAIRVAGCAVCAVDAGETGRLASEACLSGVVVVVAGDAPAEACEFVHLAESGYVAG